MKKIMSKSDEDEFFNQIILLAVKKKCTLSQFKKIENKVHQFYEDNADLSLALSQKKFIPTDSHRTILHSKESDNLSEGHSIKYPYQSSKDPYQSSKI